ncbi:MAG: PLP-dependent aminotransferase family protein [Deltaproteobacteria bacterium]|nr:PLP-dependent aminotransferase family protein [Deltaproteobacteria bacterium]
MIKTEFPINKQLEDPYLDAMNFLNEISIINPEAISFASGRPDEDFFNVEEVIAGYPNFLHEYYNENWTYKRALGDLGQYNKTNGIINDAISKLIKNDENIDSKPEDIVVTNGAQEGMCILINTLIDSEDDILMVSDPSYIGFVGYAKIFGTSIASIKRDEDSIDLEHLEQTIIQLKKEGKNPKVLYEVVDYHNPTGQYMPLDKRKKILELAEKYNFLIIEDNPYGYFSYCKEKNPVLKALDTNKRVIYLGSFSKTLFPSLRLGYLVIDQEVEHNGKIVKLVDECKKVKSFTTVNTTTILQAMAGAVLLDQNYSLKTYCKKMIAAYKDKRDEMLRALEYYFYNVHKLDNIVTWAEPDGGFFLTIEIPFQIDDDLLLKCVRDYSVIFCPINYFHIDKKEGRNKIRLAFSNVPVYKIEQGISQLALFVKDHIDIQ